METCPSKITSISLDDIVWKIQIAIYLLNSSNQRKDDEPILYPSDTKQIWMTLKCLFFASFLMEKFTMHYGLAKVVDLR